MYLRYFIPTFYNALPFGTWRKNIYTNQLPPNIENSFSCLVFFFLWDFVHLIFSEGQDQATSAIFPHGPANSASNHRWHPRQTGPFLGPTDAHRAAESVWDRMGSVDDLWIALISTPDGQTVQHFWLIWWATWWASLHIITISNAASKRCGGISTNVSQSLACRLSIEALIPQILLKRFYSLNSSGSEVAWARSLQASQHTIWWGSKVGTPMDPPIHYFKSIS